jgi:hypothetical protein
MSMSNNDDTKKVLISIASEVGDARPTYMYYVDGRRAGPSTLHVRQASQLPWSIVNAVCRHLRDNTDREVVATDKDWREAA